MALAREARAEVVGDAAGVAVADGQAARADNGGIVATVFYDATRNRFLGRQQIAYDYFAGIPGLSVELFKPATKAAEGTDLTAKQTCNGVSVPKYSYNGYELNCDGTYKTDSADGAYNTVYGANGVVSTDRC